MTETFKNYIGGEWLDGSSNNPNINPSNTNEIVGDYARASAEDTKAAIAAAKAALPAWSRSGILERHAILKKTGAMAVANFEICMFLVGQGVGEGKINPGNFGGTGGRVGR